MTIELLQETVNNSGLEAQKAMDASAFAESGLSASSPRADAIQWMQVRMLAEIALQLRVMTDDDGRQQPEELEESHG